jgi:hypothetical protein
MESLFLLKVNKNITTGFTKRHPRSVSFQDTSASILLDSTGKRNPTLEAPKLEELRY